MRKLFLLWVSVIAVTMSIVSWSQILGKGHSEADAVKNALQQADLKDVTVSDDAGKNTITLGGTLHSEEAKARAGAVAKSAAGNRQIANEISVQPVGSESQARAMASNLDDAIEDNYKAALISKGLDKQSIRYKAKNGVLVLSGTVKNSSQREQAGQLASKVPNVRQVVNQLEVHP
jgi:osmotically-inducible protein OsmY